MIIMVDLRNALEIFRELTVTMTTIDYDLGIILGELVARMKHREYWRAETASYAYFAIGEFQMKHPSEPQVKEDATVLSEAILGLAHNTYVEMDKVLHVPIWNASGNLVVEYHGINQDQLLLKTYGTGGFTGFYPELSETIQHFPPVRPWPAEKTNGIPEGGFTPEHVADIFSRIPGVTIKAINRE